MPANTIAMPMTIGERRDLLGEVRGVQRGRQRGLRHPEVPEPVLDRLAGLRVLGCLVLVVRLLAGGGPGLEVGVYVPRARPPAAPRGRRALRRPRGPRRARGRRRVDAGPGRIRGVRAGRRRPSLHGLRGTERARHIRADERQGSNRLSLEPRKVVDGTLGGSCLPTAGPPATGSCTISMTVPSAELGIPSGSALNNTTGLSVYSFGADERAPATRVILGNSEQADATAALYVSGTGTP